MKLFYYLYKAFPGGLDYADAVQLCLWLHISENAAPSDKSTMAGDREEISETLSKLALAGLIQGINIEAQQPAYWMHILNSIYHGNAKLDKSWPGKFPELFSPMPKN
jgi:hypothetical protein